MKTSRAWLGSFVVAALLLLSPEVRAQGKQDFTLENKTGYDISHVYVSPTNSESWDEDVLGQDILENNAEVDIEFARAEQTCKWDIMVTYADDNSNAFWRNIDLCTVSVITIRYNRATDKSTASFR
ncbi:MAG: argininosuccinate lyase [Oceanibaculum sp.]